MQPPKLARAVVREVTIDLQQAEAIKLVQVVGIVDRMEVRGGADDVLAPLRPRLARLRPPRPLRFARLLFHPLDPVIVPVKLWRRGDPSIPRSVITAIAAMVRSEMGAEAAGIEVIIAGHSASELPIVRAAGSKLWPAAARILAAAPLPHNWTSDTGLQEADYFALSRQIAAALQCAPVVSELTDQPHAATPQSAGRVVGEIVRQQPQALPTIMALLLTHLPDPQALMYEAEAHVPAAQMTSVHSAASTAYDFLITSAAEAPPLPGDLAVAELELRRVVDLVEAHERRPAQTSARAAKVNELARRMRNEARTRFDTALATQVMLPMRTTHAMTDADIATVEALARDVRRFEATARRIGGGEHFDKQLRHNSEALRPTANDTPQQRADKLRLVEILAGSEAARAMLEPFLTPAG